MKWLGAEANPLVESSHLDRHPTFVAVPDVEGQVPGGDAVAGGVLFPLKVC
jgi:hypothetical protein